MKGRNRFNVLTHELHVVAREELLRSFPPCCMSTYLLMREIKQCSTEANRATGTER
jgi:hypothetical protein